MPNKRKRTRTRTRTKFKSINIKKILILLSIVITFIGIGVSQSKYKSSTLEQVITLITKYHVNYQTVGGKILEPQKFNSYVSQTGLVLPVEGEVTRVRYDFQGWYNNNNYTGNPITEIASGEEGDKLFFAAWNVSQYTLKMQVKHSEDSYTNGLPSDWDLIIGKDEQGNDNVITLDSNGEIIVGKGETVSLRTRYTADVTLTGLTIDEDIVFTERYQSGDQYIYYDFIMPRHNVTATFGEEDGYIDLAKSPITFEENVDVGSIIHNGFWYKSTIKGMVPLKNDPEKGNFYDWDTSEPFYVTSKGVSTQNQLTIVGGMTVYLKNCVMAVTDDFTNDAVDRKLGSTVMERQGQGAFNDTATNSWTKYGNIVLSYNQNSIYTTNIRIEGENTIGTIFTSQYYKNNANKMTVNISGTGSDTDKAFFASSWGNMNISFSNLKVEQYDNNTSVQKTYPNKSEYFTWITAGSSTYGNVTFTKCDVNIPDKRVFTGYGYIYFYGTTATVGSLRISYSMTVSASSGAPSNVHVLGEVYVYYYGVSVNGNSKFIVDGSFRVNGYSSSGTTISNGEMVVKGNIFDAGSLNMSGGTLIANAIVIGSSASISSNARIITNVLTNCPNGRPVFSSATGQYTTTFGGTTSLTLASSNDDNIPYRNYSNSSTSNTTYTFSGGNVYLYGYYEIENGIFSNTFNTKSESNPLKDIVLEYETNGLTNITDLYLKGKMVSNTNETIILGNSANDHRTFKFSGGKVYSAGNITLFNNTNVTGGTIDLKGCFSSKKDLNVTGGTITANEIGNAYNLKTTTNNLSSWKNTNITGGTITTNKIGALTRKINNVEPKSYVSIGTGATFNTNDNNEIGIVSDVYINYLYSNLFTNDANNPNSIRFEGQLTNGTNKSLQNLEVTDPTLVDDKVSIIKPTLVANGESQIWKYESLDGLDANYVDKNGYLNADTSNSPIYLKSNMNLYAAKGNYNLKVNGENYEVTSDGDNVTFTSNNAVVKAGSTLVLSLQNPSMISKTVVWYYDDSGLLHNAITSDSVIDSANGTITFKMPYADTEINITDTLTLDIYKHHVTFTSTGFAVEYDTDRRNDSNFTYAGNLLVKQSNINKVTTVASHGMTGSGHFTNPFKIYTASNATANDTKYRMKFESGSTTLNRKITLEKIKQTLGQNEYGINIEDGENVELNVNGYVQINPIRLTENSNIVINGKNNTTDALSIKVLTAISYMLIGNTSGKSGNVTFNNIWLIHPSSGKLAYSSTKGTSKLQLNNVRYDYYAYAYGSMSYGYENVEYNNSDMLVTAGGDTANALFTSTTNVTFNNTSFKYNSGGGRTYYSLFWGVTNMYIKGSSNVVYNLRNSTTTTASSENISITSFAKLVELSDTATMSVDHRLRLNKIKINDNASLTVDKLGTSQVDIEKATYLMAYDIEVNGGLLEADNILISGYYNGVNGTTESGALSYLRNNTDILNGSAYKGLVINGGTVRANTFVGGDVNGKINVNGGTLEALGIGTSGKLYGYASYLPVVGEEYVYSIDKIPSTGTVVNVDGGTVNVLENGYLGGMRATVNVNGGTVNLASGAMIGINETDTTTMVNNITSQGNTPSELVDINIKGGTITGSNGLINTPYSTVTIDSSSSNPSIDIEYIKAEDGIINIESTANHYNNPLGSGERVGTIVEDAIIAKNITIDNGAIVYAKAVTSKTNNSSDVGNITLGANSYLYTEHYGTEGAGTSTVTINGTIVGNRQYSIQYVMNDTYADSASNPNPPSYIAGIGLELSEPTRFGYTFEGWYDNEENKITEITSTETGDKVLNARWIADEVEFVVRIKAEDLGISKEEFAEEVDLSLGSLNAAGDTFTYTETAKVAYHALMNTGLLLSKYNLASYAASAARIDNDTLNPDEDILNLTSNGSTITREIMEYYLNNDSTPININVCEFVHT